MSLLLSLTDQFSISTCNLCAFTAALKGFPRLYFPVILCPEAIQFLLGTAQDDSLFSLKNSITNKQWLITTRLALPRFCDSGHFPCSLKFCMLIMLGKECLHLLNQWFSLWSKHALAHFYILSSSIQKHLNKYFPRTDINLWSFLEIAKLLLAKLKFLKLHLVYLNSSGKVIPSSPCLFLVNLV